MASSLQKIILVAGPPGSGKSTMSRRMVETYGFRHISAGDCLREEMSNAASPHRSTIQSYIEAGKVIPVEITLVLLENKIRSFGRGSEVVVLDGFPRNADNMKGWVDKWLTTTELVHMITFNCPIDLCKERILGRMQECDRTDNASQAIHNRMGVFFEDTLPIVHSLMMAGKCTMVDATGTKDEVWDEVSQLLTRLGFHQRSVDS